MISEPQRRKLAVEDSATAYDDFVPFTETASTLRGYQLQEGAISACLETAARKVEPGSPSADLL